MILFLILIIATGLFLGIGFALILSGVCVCIFNSYKLLKGNYRPIAEIVSIIGGFFLIAGGVSLLIAEKSNPIVFVLIGCVVISIGTTIRTQVSQHH